MMFAQTYRIIFSSSKWLFEYILKDAQLLLQLPIKHCRPQNHMGRQISRAKTSFGRWQLQRNMLRSLHQLLILLLISCGRALEPFALLSTQHVALLLACAPFQPHTFSCFWQGLASRSVTASRHLGAARIALF